MDKMEAHKLLNNGQEIPEYTVVSGSLDLCEYKKVKLPNNLTITGHLFLEDTIIDVFPENLNVSGRLCLPTNYKKYLPKSLINGYIEQDTEESALGYAKYTVESFNEMIDKKYGKRVYFFAQKIKTLKKLLEIPENYDKVYYDQKSLFISLLRKI